MDCLIAYCRAGFEKECAAELQARAAEQGLEGYARAQPNSGYVAYTFYEPRAALWFTKHIAFRSLVFARQLFLSSGLLKDLPVTDRLAPILAALENQCQEVSAVWVETADTNEAKQLLGFCRQFSTPLRKALEQRNRLNARSKAAPKAHVFFLSSVAAYPGISNPTNSSPWFMGIPRLKHSRQAPSRAALKLEEAWLVLLTPAQRAAQLRSGMRVVDLGAAPGGWTWQFVRQGLQVTAVDNGPLAPALIESGLVEHRRQDGFRYIPRQPVDWMVCDMVEQPRRVAQLAANWLVNGWCRQCLLNLKLPMKKRYHEMRLCRKLIAEILNKANIPWELTLKQLYHDREEVTGYLRRIE
jgi:23S rRNA (cytidine2498-2'-O)-methyltransferase